jgi:hypothetical protein
VDLRRASHSEVSFTVAQSRFGGNLELASSGEQLEARLGGLVRDYPTDPVVCLIYSVLEWWPPILDWRASGRRRKESLAHEISGCNRGNLTGDLWIGEYESRWRG